MFANYGIRTIQNNEPMKTQENTDKLLKFVYYKFVNEELNNDSLLKLIELCGDLLNLQSIPKYAKENNMSYNGVKNYRRIVKIFGNKLVLDNK